MDKVVTRARVDFVARTGVNRVIAVAACDFCAFFFAVNVAENHNVFVFEVFAGVKRAAFFAGEANNLRIALAVCNVNNRAVSRVIVIDCNFRRAVARADCDNRIAFFIGAERNSAFLNRRQQIVKLGVERNDLVALFRIVIVKRGLCSRIFGNEEFIRFAVVFAHVKRRGNIALHYNGICARAADYVNFACSVVRTFNDNRVAAVTQANFFRAGRFFFDDNFVAALIVLQVNALVAFKQMNFAQAVFFARRNFLYAGRFAICCEQFEILREICFFQCRFKC